jgi:hypothetical protein
MSLCQEQRLRGFAKLGPDLTGVHELGLRMTRKDARANVVSQSVCPVVSGDVGAPPPYHIVLYYEQLPPVLLRSHAKCQELAKERENVLRAYESALMSEFFHGSRAARSSSGDVFRDYVFFL